MDGVPDYLADGNGNGLDDAGEIPWDVAILEQPMNQVASLGGAATFSVVAGGNGYSRFFVAKTSKCGVYIEGKSGAFGMNMVACLGAALGD
jgi:hypothetical protein